jgi:hypothetical protein
MGFGVLQGFSVYYAVKMAFYCHLATPKAANRVLLFMIEHIASNVISKHLFIYIVSIRPHLKSYPMFGDFMTTNVETALQNVELSHSRLQ